MRTSGESNLKKLVYLVVGVVIVIVAMTWLEPFFQEYELKTGIRLTCNELFRTSFDTKHAHEFFVGKATRAGVKLKEEDYDEDCPRRIDKGAKCWSIEAEHDKTARLMKCRAYAQYPTETEWALVGQVLQEIPKLKQQHKVTFKIEMQDRW